MAVQAMTETELIAQYIEASPHQPGTADARLAGYGVPVWALVGHYFAVQRNPQQVALDYELPLEAVKAALAYYERHKPVIDARIEANVA